MSKEASEKTSGINWARVLEVQGMRNEDGSPDVTTLMRFLEEEVTSWISKHDITVPEIDEALEKMHEKFPSGGFDLAGICNKAMNEIVSVPPGTESKVLKRIGSFIRAESNKFKRGDDGKWFLSAGHGARVQRITPEFADEYWQKQEAKAIKENG